MNTSNTLIREMNREDVDLAISWAEEEGWHPGINDADCFYAVDPHGFFVAEENGRPVGSISAVSYGDAFGFIGLFVVIPERRGHRVGRELGKCALEYLLGKNVGVDGVLNKVKNYESAGFKFCYCNARYEGRAPKTKSHSSQTVSLNAVPFAEVLKYDTDHFPAERKLFLQSWLTQKGAYSAMVYRSGKILGYGLIRPCAQTYKIGPLFAADEEVAANIIDSLLAHIPDQKYYLDVPEINADALHLVQSRRLLKVFATARMYNGEEPKLPHHEIFGITTFELG